MALKTKHNRLKNILITAATGLEVPDLLPGRHKTATGSAGTILRASDSARVDLLITGPGIHATTYHLTRQLARNRYDLVMNVGICGSLDPAVKPVRLVRITSDAFADFGAEDGSDFLDAFQLGLENPNRYPYRKGRIRDSFSGKLSCLLPLLRMDGITVNKAHGSATSARRARERFGKVAESMEGAAVFYTSRMEHTDCIQVRAVSNLVEKRRRDQWKIKEAVDALSGFTGLFLLEWSLMHAGQAADPE